MAWSVESLPSNPLAWVRFPAGSGILISVLGLGMCPLCSVLCCLWRRSWHYADHTFREACPCVSVYSASSQRWSLTVTFLCCQLKWGVHSFDSYGWLRGERQACHNKVITRPTGLKVPVWQLWVVSIATDCKQWPWLGFCQNCTSLVTLWLDTFILYLTSSIFRSSLTHLFRDRLWVELL